MKLIARCFSFDDLSADQGWDLLEWCRTRGAEEFTIEGIYLETQSPQFGAFFEALAPYALPSGPRRRLSAPTRDEFVREVDLWRLIPATIDMLQRGFPHGFVANWRDTQLWLEDLTVYRNDEFMMGVLTHEGGGVVRVTETELAELRASGFPDRNELEWVGYGPEP